MSSIYRKIGDMIRCHNLAVLVIDHINQSRKLDEDSRVNRGSLRSRVVAPLINLALMKVVKCHEYDMSSAHTESATFTVLDAVNLEAVKHRLMELYPDLSVCARDGFKLAQRFVSIVQEERKVTTIRYTRNAVEYPCCSRLPMFCVSESAQFEPEYAGTVSVVGLCYKPFGSLDELDASKDGFPTANDLKAELREIYGQIRDDEIVTIFAINPEFSHIQGGS